MGRPVATDRPEVAAWKEKYSQLDDATLLSVVPALEALLSDAQQQLEFLGKHYNERDANQEFRTHHLHAAIDLRAQGFDVAEYVASIDAQAESSDRAKKGVDEMSRKLLGYASDLLDRKRWILYEEAPRRGLLPALDDFPYPSLG
jgi:hypothetical protein